MAGLTPSRAASARSAAGLPATGTSDRDQRPGPATGTRSRPRRETNPPAASRDPHLWIFREHRPAIHRHTVTNRQP